MTRRISSFDSCHLGAASAAPAASGGASGGSIWSKVKYGVCALMLAGPVVAGPAEDYAEYCASCHGAAAAT